MSLSVFQDVFFPYSLERQSDGSYAVLNREYKPVGFFTRDWVTYSEHPVLVKIKLTKAIARKLSDTGEDSLERIFLYNDKTKPTRSSANMKAYLSRLTLLAKLRVS